MTTIVLSPVDVAAIAAMAKHIATDESCLRGFMSGVWVEFTADATRAVATDGHALVAVKLRAYDYLNGASVFITRNQALEFRRAKGSVALIFDECGAGPRGHSCIAVINNAEHGAPDYAVSVELPVWQNCIKLPASGELAQYDPQLLARVDNVALAVAAAINKDARRKYNKTVPGSHMTMNGEHGPAIVTYSNLDMIAAVMPWREHVAVEIPEWFMAQRYAEKAAKAA